VLTILPRCSKTTTDGTVQAARTSSPLCATRDGPARSRRRPARCVAPASRRKTQLQPHREPGQPCSLDARHQSTAAMHWPRVARIIVTAQAAAGNCARRARNWPAAGGSVCRAADDGGTAQVPTTRAAPAARTLLPNTAPSAAHRASHMLKPSPVTAPAGSVAAQAGAATLRITLCSTPRCHRTSQARRHLQRHTVRHSSAQSH